MKNNFFTEVIEQIKKKKPDKARLNSIKNTLSKKYKLKSIPTNIEILLNANVKDIEKIKKYLLTKPTRTISGVAVVAIMTKPMKCPHGKCLMCPGGVDSAFGNVPQSYTGKEPATRRAIRNNYDPYLQVINRLEQYVVQGHVPEKVELIVMGGTFPSVNKKYQEEFIKNSFKAMNDFSRLFFKNKKFDFVKFRKFFELPGDINDKKRLKRIHKKLLDLKGKSNLKKEQELNEKSNIKCVALCIETRPDYATLKYAKEMLRFGATRVELGIQSVYDDVLAKIERGHSVEDSIKATKVLKDLGFKVSYQVMPGLPGVSKEQDLAGLMALFEYENFRPDMLKIYPCMVLKGTKLYNLWKKKKYKPLTTKKAASLIAEFKKHVPEYCRISRVQRDIPTFMTEAGVDMTNLRQVIEKSMKKKCRCIRCREAGHKLKDKKIKVKDIEAVSRYYEASDGVEFFISAEDVKNDILFGICRLRFPDSFLTKEINESSALVRELHVYGEAVEIGKKGSIQHKGIGKKLLEEAEKTAKMYNRKKIVVISGIGVRNYYKKLGYKKEGKYMVKFI